MLSIRWAEWIMGVATLLAPFGTYFYSLRNSTITVSVQAILWGAMPEESGNTGSLILDLYIIVGRGLFYGIFNIWFGIEVIRYYKDYTRRGMVIVSGLLSLVYPLVLAIISWPWIRSATTFVYIGPIPIQLVVGILLMKHFGEARLREPWSD